MQNHYGQYQSWIDLTKAFGKIIEKLPNNKPIRMWPIACAIVGEKDQHLAKTLIQQFSNIGAIDIASEPKKSIELREFFVNSWLIEEIRWD